MEAAYEPDAWHDFGVALVGASAGTALRRGFDPSSSSGRGSCAPPPGRDHARAARDDVRCLGRTPDPGTGATGARHRADADRAGLHNALDAGDLPRDPFSAGRFARSSRSVPLRRAERRADLRRWPGAVRALSEVPIWWQRASSSVCSARRSRSGCCSSASSSSGTRRRDPRRRTAPDNGGPSHAAGRSRERLLYGSCGRRAVSSPRRTLSTSCSRTCGLTWARWPPASGCKAERRPRAGVSDSRREFGCAPSHSTRPRTPLPAGETSRRHPRTERLRAQPHGWSRLVRSDRCRARRAGQFARLAVDGELGAALRAGPPFTGLDSAVRAHPAVVAAHAGTMPGAFLDAPSVHGNACSRTIGPRTSEGSARSRA